MSNTTAEVSKTVETSVRKITIVTTRGEKVKIAFEGNDWKSLKALLEKGGKDVDGKSFFSYSLSNMKCVESVNRTTLEHPQAVIPAGDFNLFLMPYKSKSGAMSRPEINAAIKEHIARDGDKAKDFFSEGGKNYTQVSSSVLETKLEQYKPGTVKAASKARAEATSNVADVVASVKDAKEGNLFEELQGLSTDEKLDIVIKLLIDMKNGKPATQVAEVAQLPSAPVETEEAKQARLKKEAEEAAAKAKAEAEAKAKREEDEKLEREMREMASGFDDVRI